MKKLINILILIALFSTFDSNAQITIDDSQSFQWNVMNKLAGPGVAISNIRFNNETIDEVNPQIGNFDASATNIGINSGVILSNGNINSVLGPNDDEHAFMSTTNPAPTDADLIALASPQPAFDGAVLEFSFIPNGDTVEFDFVFASEEYPEFVGSGSNDVFGFFVAGPGITGPFSSPNYPPYNMPNGSINVALIPGTPTPVSIDNVNAVTNSSYFVSNGDGNTAPYNTDPQYIQADGFTTPITVKFPVVCGEQYYIKFAIADVFDALVDSYVFIEENSFSTITPVQVAVADGTTTLTEGCDDITLEFDRMGDLSIEATVNLTVSGTATNGIDITNVPSTLTFPIGEASVSLTLDALADALVESGEWINIHVENYGTTFCGNPIESDVTINFEDNVSGVMSGDNTICQGETANVEINFNGTGPWDIEYTVNGTPQTETVSTSPHVISVNSTSTLVLTSVSKNGCAGDASGSAQVAVVNTPTMTVSGGGEACDGDDVQVTLDFTGSGPFTYEYSINSVTQPAVTTNDYQVILDIDETGLIEPVSIQSTGGATCTGTVSGSANVTIHDIPTISVPTDVFICSGSPAEIPITLTGTGPFDVTYNFNNTGDVVLSGISDGHEINTTNVGNYNFTNVTYSNAPFCSTNVTLTTEIQNITAPTAEISDVDTTLCLGSSYGVEVNFTGVGPFIIEYTDGDNDFGPITTSDNPYLINVTNDSDIELTSFSDSQCQGTFTGLAEISIAPPIVNSSNLIYDICDGESVTLPTLLGGGINEPYIYNWEHNSLNIGSDSSVDVSPALSDPNVSESFTYFLTASQTTCSSDYLFQYTVNVHAIPSAEFITDDETICPGSSMDLVFSNQGDGEMTVGYMYNSVAQSNVVTSDAIFNLSINQEGLYQLTSISDDYCTNSTISDHMTLSHYDLPEATLSDLDTLVCIGEQVDVEVNFTGAAPFTFERKVDGVVIETITTSDNPYILNINTPGTHSIGEIQDTHCSNQGTGEATMTYTTPIDFTMLDDLVICEGQQLQLQATNIVGGDPSNYIFTWTSANGDVLSNDPDYSVIAVESDTFTLTINDLCNAPTVKSTEVTVEETPIVLFDSDQDGVCPGDVVFFDNSSIMNTTGNEFTWSFGDGKHAYTMNANHVYEFAGLYDVALTITTPAGCSASETVIEMILVNDVTDPEFTFDPLVGNMSDPEINFQVLNTSYSSIIWNFGDGQEEEDTPNPSHLYPEDQSGIYLACLELANDFGCLSELCQEVEIQPIYNAFIPTAFTPDGDGHNEIFKPVLHTSTIDTYEFKVYDRDGHTVFVSNDPTWGWNGSYMHENGYYAPVGVYTWEVKIKLRNHSDVKLHKGNVTLMR